MECLQYLFLADSGIVKFPSSIGNLTGLRHIFLGRCKNLVHLSYIIHLQHLERISLEDCSKLVELPKDQVKKFEASSNAELLSSSLLPPLTNSSICNDSPSSMAFPQLADLILNNCSLSNDIFSFITLHCPSMLKYLDISRTDITTLTEIVKPFVGLRIDRVEYSKQFEEIVQLTPNIIDVCATGCMSVESFPTVSKRFGFNISEFRRLKRIGLCASRTIKVDIGNPAANPLLHEVRKEDLIPCGLLFPGDKIPDWFSHHKETSIGNSCEIDIVGLLDLDEIIGIFLCAVVRPILPPASPKAPTQDVGPRLPDIEAEITGNVGPSCGVHLERKHDWNVKDHPGVLREDVDVIWMVFASLRDVVTVSMETWISIRTLRRRNVLKYQNFNCRGFYFSQGRRKGRAANMAHMDDLFSGRFRALCFNHPRLQILCKGSQKNMQDRVKCVQN
ncbi:hypothetical protein CJ030_MR0G003776 [Morella rubra]|uniref:TMV resistance protein N n=1 Tax=Morella rubra TaxID=262757 RepID=A0A6A1UMG6_9ROSI|nr:hypothetical protein CJ030_MR0G003776 [Morella rubra]